MLKNITLCIDEKVLKKARQEAVKEKKSFSQWVTDLIIKRIKDKDD